MLLIPINWWAVLVCAIVFQIVGWLWYSPLLFGKRWMQLMEMTPEQIESGKKDKAKMMKTVATSFVSSLVLIYAMAVFVSYSVVATISGGILIGLVLWIGFVATTNAMEYIWNPNRKPWELYFLNVGYYLVTMVLAGVILSLWS